MVKDYFSIYSKNSSLFLLRIHHKVDFADEIAWAHCWNCPQGLPLEELASFVAEYLVTGFDVLEQWNSLDNAAYHESIKHLGFREELVEMDLIPRMIVGHDPIVNSIKSRLQQSKEGGTIKVPTSVGALANALKEIGQPVKHPRVPTATLEVWLDTVFNEEWQTLANQVNNYSAQ